jgi:predicted ATPase
MALHLQNLSVVKKKLDSCSVNGFVNVQASYRNFVSRLKIARFRKLVNCEILFKHPVTVIAGTNTVGKTSILILLACSHEQFIKFDSTSPASGTREHGWNDMLAYTNHEGIVQEYSYELDWRVGAQVNSGWGKRQANTRSWSGLGKKSSDLQRVNAKIRNRQVRLIDLERVLPGRSFSNALFRKANLGNSVRLRDEIEQAFSYIFDYGNVEISEVGSHINKHCFLITRNGQSYSSFNAASGEDSVIYLLKDIIESPPHSLILIDEVEAGFHPAVQRKIADIIQYIAWRDKKQFVVTTHSPTFLSAFSAESRVFIEGSGGVYRVIPRIPPQAARSKMDSLGHPLLRVYCEDDLAEFLIYRAILDSRASVPDGARLINIVRSGPVDQVNVDYVRHKRNFSQYRNKVGCCAIFDGDYIDDQRFSMYVGAQNDFAGFIYPHMAPEKFLVTAYLAAKPNAALESSLQHSDHHSLFNLMVTLGLAADEADARNTCYESFKLTPEYITHRNDIALLVGRALEHYSRVECE